MAPHPILKLMGERGGGRRAVTCNPNSRGFFCSNAAPLHKLWVAESAASPSQRHLPLPSGPQQRATWGKPAPGGSPLPSPPGASRGASSERSGWTATKPRGSREWGAVTGAGSARGFGQHRMGLWPGMMGGAVRSSAPEGMATILVQSAERQEQGEAGEEKRRFFATKRKKKARKSRNRPKRKSKLTRIVGRVNYGGAELDPHFAPPFFIAIGLQSLRASRNSKGVCSASFASDSRPRLS